MTTPHPGNNHPNNPHPDDPTTGPIPTPTTNTGQHQPQPAKPTWPGNPTRPASPGGLGGPGGPGAVAGPYRAGNTPQQWPPHPNTHGTPGYPGAPSYPGTPTDPSHPTHPGQSGQSGQPGYPGQSGYFPGAPQPARRSRRGLLIAALLITVAAITAATTLAIINHTNPPTTAANNHTADYASADDTGPLTIITDEPTCTTNGGIIDALHAEGQKGWDKRNAKTPADQWTPEERTMYMNMGKAFSAAAEQMVPLAKQTPHRIIRELFEQAIAAIHTYVAALPHYQPIDDNTITIALLSNDTRNDICWSLYYQSALPAAVRARPVPSPVRLASLPDPANPVGFMPHPDPICGDLNKLNEDTDAKVNDWISSDHSVPATDWSPEQRTLNTNAAPVIHTRADRLLELAGRTDNPLTADLLTFSALYARTFADALPNYTRADIYLYSTSIGPPLMVAYACDAAGWKP